MKKPLYRAKCLRTGKWIYGALTPSKKAIAEDKGSRLLIDPETIGEYVFTHKGKDRFTGDVFFEEVEQDEGDRRLFTVLVWLPDHFCYTLLHISDYFLCFVHNGVLDEDEHYGLSEEDIELVHYKGTIFDQDFKDLLNG